MVKNKSKIVYIRWMMNGFEIWGLIRYKVFYFYLYLLLFIDLFLWRFVLLFWGRFGLFILKIWKGIMCVFLCISEIILYDFRRVFFRGCVIIWYLYVVYIFDYIWGFWFFGVLYVIYVNLVFLINIWDVFLCVLYVRFWVW